VNNVLEGELPNQDRSLCCQHILQLPSELRFCSMCPTCITSFLLNVPHLRYLGQFVNGDLQQVDQTNGRLTLFAVPASAGAPGKGATANSTLSI
jgi:hypothetical protein